jgi:hypothetical protein
MELLSAKFGSDFNSVQLVGYLPEGLVEENNLYVGMNWHSDDEQYLSGVGKENLNEIDIATLNIFTSRDDNMWCFNVRPKGKYTYTICTRNLYFPSLLGTLYLHDYTRYSY